MTIKDIKAGNIPHQPVNVGQLEYALKDGCNNPGCKHDHTDLYFRSKCHPKHKGVDVRYTKGTGVLTIECSVCQQHIVSIRVGLV